MARVALSTRICNEIIFLIRSKFDSRIAEIKKSYSRQDIVDGIRDTLVIPEVLAFAKNHPKWFNWYESISIKLAGTDFVLLVDASVARNQIPAKPGYGGSYSHHQTHVFMPDTAVGKLLQQAQAECTEVEQERDKLVARVQQLLDSAPSLNRVAEVWPSVLEYIPDDVRGRYNAPDVPRKSKRTMVQLDEDSQVSLVKLNLNADEPKT